MDARDGVLIVDDEIKLCRNIALKLEKKGYTTYQAYNGQTALDIVKKRPVRVVLLDYMLTDMTGLDVLKQIKEQNPRISVYMLTAYGNIESAVMAMKLGASDFFNKPVELNRISQVVESVYNPMSSKKPSEEMVFESEKMKKIRGVLDQVIPTDASILLLGESGVGKTALAKWIHQKSHRRKKPFILINCAAIPESLLESELFGYNKGAFTGAMESRAGKFEAANGGTIFLDEIGEITLGMQAKLLHVIEEKSFMRLGSHHYQTVDVRIITATNKNLKQLVKEGRFREDLYYRLNLVEIEIPPLRERKEDIPILINQTLNQLNQKYSKQITLSEDAMNRLIEYSWPGNIRELLNTLERMHILKPQGVIDVCDLPPFLEPNVLFSSSNKSVSYLRLQDALDHIEEKLIKEALKKTGGNQTKAAELLGISRNTLIYKIKKMKRYE